MTTLFNSELSGRDFGSQLLHTGDLMAWAESKRLHLPDIAGFEFVQVEALLCAIERQDLTPEQAFEIVANDPALKNHRAADDPITARWLLGAAAHKKWRELLSVAIERHELTLLDFASKLPINAPATDTATPAPVETPQQRQDRRLQACIDAGLPMNTKKALIRLPDGIGDVADQENVTRQSFSSDVKAALNRRESAKRDGVTVHRT